MPRITFSEPAEWSGCREPEKRNTGQSDAKYASFHHCRGGETNSAWAKSFNTPPSRPGAPFPFPSALKVAGRVYRVVVDDDGTVLRDDQWGMLDQRRCAIFVKDGLDQYVTAEVLFHEILHAILVATATQAREEDVERVAMALWSFIHDNAEAINGLLEYFMTGGDQ